MSQYFENDSSIKEKDIEVKFEILGKSFIFKSSNGVFSKNKLDKGSEIFIKTLIKLNLTGKILDLGCGIGVVGCTLAKFNDASYVLVDVNERAVELAEQNIKNLRLSSRCNALVSDIFSSIEKKTFDSILLNPPIRAGKKVIYQMYSDSYEHLNSGGSLFIVIRIKQGALSSFKYLQTIYKNVSIIDRGKGYQIIRCDK